MASWITLHRNMISTLIATLGSEAQVVTIACDLLARRDRHVRRVIVLHTSPETNLIGAALARLAEEMPVYPGVRYSPVLLRDGYGDPLADVDSPDSAAAAFRGIYQTIRAAKRDGEIVDVCLAGGRKAMSAFAMAASQLLFEDDDRLWHLVSAGALLLEKRMHPRSGDSAALVELPVLRYGDVSPMYSEVAEADDPFEAVQRTEARGRSRRIALARAFVREHLSEAERRVAGLLLREGLSDAEIATRLFVAPRTVSTQLASIYRKAEGAFGLAQVSARALASLLGPIAGEI